MSRNTMFTHFCELHCNRKACSHKNIQATVEFPGLKLLIAATQGSVMIYALAREIVKKKLRKRRSGLVTITKLKGINPVMIN